MFKIAWKSFRYNIKSFIVFFLSAIFTVTMTFGFLYLGQLTKEIKVDGIPSSLGYHLGETIPVIIVVSMCIMAYTVKFYILSRMKDYSMLLLLGIRKKTFIMFIALEYVFSWILSIIVGLVCGNLFVKGFRFLLGKLAGDDISYSVVDEKSLYIKVILCCVALVIGVIVVILVYLGEKDVSEALKVNVVKERKPVRKEWLGLAVFGLVINVIALYFSYLTGAIAYRNAGTMQLIASTVGCYLILQFGLGVWLERFKTKRENSYYKNMLKLNNYYHRMNNNINMMALQMIIGMAVIYFVWTVSGGIWRTDASQYPYDFICMATEEDAEKVQEICNKYGEEVTSFKYVENYYGNVRFVGVPNSTSEQIWGVSVDLKDDEFFYLVGARDLYIFEEKNPKKFFALGWDNWVHYSVEWYTLKGHKRQLGLGENMDDVAVFSDKKFKELWNRNEANRVMVMMNTNPSRVDEAEKELKKFLEKCHYTEILPKKSYLRSERMEGIVRFSSTMFTAIALLIYLLFVLCVKIYSELPIMREKYTFLRTLGMRKTDRRKMLKKEIQMFLLPSTFLAALLGFAHCIGYSAHDVHRLGIPFHLIAEYSIPSALWILPQMVVYLIVMILFTFIMSNLVVRWVEKEELK